MLSAHYFEYEEAELRIRPLGLDTGVRDAGRAGYQKWVLEHKGGRRWTQDAWIVLPNGAGSRSAIKRFGVG